MVCSGAGPGSGNSIQSYLLMERRQKTYVMCEGARILLAVGVLFVVMFAVAVSAEIYSWTDQQGTRHFSDSPPQQAADLQMTTEIPHDKTADQQHDDAYRQMLEEVAQRRVERETVENKALRERLEAAEHQSMAARKKAEEALKAAKEAQEIASEKQRYREVYVIPRGAIAPYPNSISDRFPVWGSYSYPPQLN
jgi:hypothetical protein